MLVRTLAGLLALPLLFLVIFVLPDWGVPMAYAVLGALAAYELVSAAGLAKRKFLPAISASFAVLVQAWAYFGFLAWPAVLGLLLFVAILFAYGMRHIGEVSFETVAVTLFAGILIPFFFSLIVPVYLSEHGKALVFLPFLSAWLSDTGAYFSGSLFGKHKLCPTISPKKSVEGAVGAVVISVAGHGLFAFLLASVWNYSVFYPAFLAAGAIGSIAGQSGDLIFSFIKRNYGVKDFGRILPGHGGVLDRFDSVFLTTPVVFVLWSVLTFISA
jgi:phosphatidate cytidylyltransferase